MFPLLYSRLFEFLVFVVFLLFFFTNGFPTYSSVSFLMAGLSRISFFCDLLCTILFYWVFLCIFQVSFQRSEMPCFKVLGFRWLISPTKTINTHDEENPRRRRFQDEKTSRKNTPYRKTRSET